MTKRGFLRSLTAGTLAGIPAVKSVEVLNVKPRDTLVLSFPGALTQDDAERLREAVKQKFPHNEVIVLSEGLDLKVIRG